MDKAYIEKLFHDTAYIRTGGSDEELRAAEYIRTEAEKLGIKAYFETFPVLMGRIDRAEFSVNGKAIPCKALYDCGSTTVEAPLYYLRDDSKISLSRCKDRIVLLDKRINNWLYHDILENGALGFISSDGDANYADNDIDQRELRETTHKGRRIPSVNINIKDTIELVRNGLGDAVLSVEQETWQGESRNVIAELPGEVDEWIVLTAHYDSTSLSQGAYDNMSGAVGLLGLVEYFVSHPHRFGLRFIWCGSEERGLLGSKAYCAAHEEELKKIVLDINLDMIGCIMGKFIYCVSGEEKLCNYIEYLCSETGFPISGTQGVYSSDSTPFADKGVPSLSFARIAPHTCATIHNRYDTYALMSPEQLIEDIEFIVYFTDRLANALFCPVERVIPEPVKEKLDKYMGRKRPEKKKD